MNNTNDLNCIKIDIIDLANVTLSHFLQYGKTLIKSLIKIIHIAGDQKELHFINTPFGFSKVSDLFTSIYNSKVTYFLFIENR